ncbi:NnrU family protein [Pelomonas sp. SE-A7]|uniref:NnrU family protein n=1 Tax=Pelomonas sp. SE-A7 TaxID=3054953 RepID=UPI00259D0B7A|nr:NnrU family protein [Pelomonas sp. SE-A7]MDM4768042.1 NnrU family protein [Pelomonas sp. SE-A7]
MTELVAGLLIFLGLHSVRIFADDWRSRQIARLGDKPWKLSYTLLSLLGFGLIVHGYGQARLDPIVLWATPPGMNHLAALLTLVAFVLFTAAYVPGNQIKAKLGHPMLLGTKVWALAHLLANNQLADLLLFGGFLLWAILCFRSSRRRDAAAGLARPAGSAARTALTVVFGAAAWAAFAFWGHSLLIGVRPL